jgi:Tfp pilus assembly protein PilV
MSVKLRPSAKGFTILELLIASSIFTLVLILITTGVLQFSRQYYKGVIASKTQDTARAIVDDVSRAIQLNTGQVSRLTINGNPVTPGNQVRGYCIGEVKRYSFVLNRQVTDSGTLQANQSRHALIADNTTGCSSNTPARQADTNAIPLGGTNARELLGQNMRLTKFSITQTSGDLYNITVRIIYGDNDLLCSPSGPQGCAPNANFPPNATDLTCKSSAGSQFCAVSELSTTVQKRVN